MGEADQFMTDNSSAYGERTRAIHAPGVAPFGQAPEGLPIYRTAAFAFATARDYADVLGGAAPGYSYSRVDNPTSDAFARVVAEAEGHGLPISVSGQPFASGMAAISTVLMAFTGAGAHVVAPREIYGGTYALLHDVLARFGVDTTFVDGTDIDAVAGAVRPETRVVWAETLANPTMSVADLPRLAEIAHSAGALLCVDSTFATPAVCRPLRWGADVVVHSATKYIGGHGDVTGGVAVGRGDVIDAVRHMRIDLGGSLAPDEAYLLHRGMATLPLRMQQHCANALSFAEAMVPFVADGRLLRVDYPGLETHRDHSLAEQLFEAGSDGVPRFGAVVTLTPPGGREEGLAFCDELRLVRIATSLGGLHTKVSHVPSTTHRQLDGAALAAAGIGASAVRFSIGLEDPDDLVTDVRRALDRISRRLVS